MLRIIKALTPVFVLGILLTLSVLIPENAQLQDSSMTKELPLGYDLDGWHGTRRQESPSERSSLAKDTLFSKADYRRVSATAWEKRMPDIHVSLVFSGSDMNNSIHRPEMCLPAQGHQNLQGSSTNITLDNGRSIYLTRLTSYLPSAEPGKRLNFIHYYTFVGHGNLCHDHMKRMLIDIRDRTLLGTVQRWAYFQVGTFWGTQFNITEEEADEHLRKLICQLLPRIIDWEELEN